MRVFAHSGAGTMRHTTARFYATLKRSSTRTWKDWACLFEYTKGYTSLSLLLGVAVVRSDLNYSMTSYLPSANGVRASETA